MKKILVSFGLILTLVLCCALVPVNAAEECAHEKVTFQYFLEGQSAPTTCAESGIAKYTCDSCKASVYKKEVGKHVVEYDITDASCTESQKVIEVCTVCETVLKETEVTPALGHDWKETAVDASCDLPAGIATKCTRCDAKKEFAAFEEGHELYAPAIGHKWADKKVVKATCKEGGYTLQECANCKGTQKVNETEKDTVNGHKAKLVSVLKEAVCDANGIGKFKCELCEEELGYGSIPAGHKWDEANIIVVEAPTCGKAGKGTLVCSLCDAKKENVEISNKGIEHAWVDVVLDEDCTNPARVGKKCTACNKLDVTVVEGSKPLGHTWAEQYKDATCDKASGILKECLACDATEFVEFEEGSELYVAPKGHKEVEIKAVAATCSKEGLTAGVKCSVCNTVLVKQEKVAKNPDAHTAQLVETLKAPGCTTLGVGKYACKDCKKDLGYKAIEATHAWELTEVLEAPTCTKEGKGTYTCSVCEATKEDKIAKAAHDYAEVEVVKCGEKIKVVQVCKVCEAEGKVISEGAVKEHNWEKDVVVDASCVLYGYVADVCVDCYEVKILSIVTEALGHDFAETLVEASCDKPNGVKRACKRCDVVEVVYFAETDPLYVAAKGHKEVEVKAVAATCSKEGLTAGVKCSVCNTVLVEQEKVAKNPDNHTAELVATLKAETCTTNGVGKYACKDCKKDLGYKAIPAAHKLGELVVDTAATCTKEGKGHKDCTVCDYVEKDIVIKKAAHTYVEKAIDATCTEPAKVGKECSVCKAQKDVVVVEGSKPLGHKLSEKYVAASCTDPSGILTECSECDYEKFVAFTEADGELYVAAKGHKEVEIKAVAATCAKEGLTAGVKCSVCNVVLVKQEKVAKDPEAHTSALVATLKAETCTTSGVGKYACKDCKKDLGYKAIPAAHKLGELVVDTAATCGKAGKGHKDCLNCDYVEKDIVIKATGKHTMVADTVIDATCTTPSRVGTICSVCGKEDKDVVSVGKPNGHDWKETPVEATCTTPAGVQKECKVCKAKEFEAYTGELEEAAKGHNYEAVVVEGTCKTAGYTADVCKTCKDVQNKVEGSKNPTNHNPKADIIIKEPTCTTTGVAKSVCEDCGEALGYIAVAAGHSFAEEAKATEDGTLVYVECENCDAIKAVAYFGKKEVVLGTVFESLAKYQEAEAAK